MSSRAATKAALREERIAVEREQADAASRRRRLQILAGLVAAAAAVVVIALAVSSSGGGSEKPAGGDGLNAAATLSLIGGIPQQGLALGKADAPLTLVEYADMQCPACKMYSDQAFPAIVEKYVRTGKLRIEIRLQSFLGPDSVTAAGAIAAASLQDEAWTMIDLFYRNQGTENTGYVTNGFLTDLADAVPGLDSAQLLRDANGPRAREIVQQGSAAFAANGFDSTPSFQLGRTGGELSVLNVESFDPAQFTGAIDSLLAS